MDRRRFLLTRWPVPLPRRSSLGRRRPAELVRLNPDIIITYGTPTTLAPKRATSTIPIVMSIIGNPVENGAVTSLARPGGNITGSSFFSDEVTAKRLES